jgi:glucosylceramidase
MKDPKLRKYVSGFAVHWYWDSLPFSRMSFLDDAHNQFPDKYIFYSEASIGKYVNRKIRKHYPVD